MENGINIENGSKCNRCIVLSGEITIDIVAESDTVSEIIAKDLAALEMMLMSAKAYIESLNA